MLRLRGVPRRLSGEKLRQIAKKIASQKRV